MYQHKQTFYKYKKKICTEAINEVEANMLRVIDPRKDLRTCGRTDMLYYRHSIDDIPEFPMMLHKAEEIMLC